MKRALLLLPFLVILGGCPSTKEVRREQPPAPAAEPKPRAPDIAFTVASLDMADVQRRIEQSDLGQFTATLKKENIDILALQNVVRYPGVATRIDPIDELTRATDMQTTFGEIMNNAGRQTGNAVLTAYTLRSSAHTPYDGLRAAAEASHAVIDCGAREIVAVSTGVPPKPTTNETRVCLATIAGLPRQYEGRPMMVAGNLEDLGTKPSEEFSVIHSGAGGPTIWYSAGGAFVVHSQRVVRTVFGPMLIARLGLFRQ